LSRQGGIERASFELAERLAACGHTVDYHAARCSMGTPRGVQFRPVRILSGMDSLELATFSCSARKQLASGFYDVTHSHGTVPGCDIVTAHSCHRAGLNAMKTFGAAPAGAHRNRGITDRVRLEMEKRIYRKRAYRRVIAVADGVRRELIDSYGIADEDVVVIPNGVDLGEFSPEIRARKSADARHSWGLARGDEVILFVGNEFHRKGLRLAIEAVARVRKPGRKLLVIGKDDPAPYLRYAEELGIASAVIMAGTVREMSSAYAAADLFLLPSSYEAFSLALIEAAASGLPLLSTRVNGSVELIRPEVNGLFIPQNAAVIAECLEGVLGNDALRRKMGEEARKCALPYSWEAIADRTVAVYEEVVRLRKGN
jgi:UDP-glucose:(heptosyl)LPS alpha-1,3-glucosyltransferase